MVTLLRFEPTSTRVAVVGAGKTSIDLLNSLEKLGFANTTWVHRGSIYFLNRDYALSARHTGEQEALNRGLLSEQWEQMANEGVLIRSQCAHLSTVPYRGGTTSREEIEAADRARLLLIDSLVDVSDGRLTVLRHPTQQVHTEKFDLIILCTGQKYSSYNDTMAPHDGQGHFRVYPFGLGVIPLSYLPYLDVILRFLEDGNASALSLEKLHSATPPFDIILGMQLLLQQFTASSEIHKAVSLVQSNCKYYDVWFNKKIDLHELLLRPTPSFCSSVVTRKHFISALNSFQSQPILGLLVCVRRGDPLRVPVIILYAGIGIGYGSGLDQYLSDNTPIFQTQNPEYTVNVTFNSLEDRVDHHAAALVEVFGAQHLHLVGYSAGAVLATEIAARIPDQTTVTLVDPMPAAVIGINPSLSELHVLAAGIENVDALDSWLPDHAPLDVQGLVTGEQIASIKELHQWILVRCAHDENDLRRVLHMAKYSTSFIEAVGKDRLARSNGFDAVPSHARVVVSERGLDELCSGGLMDLASSTQMMDGAHGWAERFRSVECITVVGGHMDVWTRDSNAAIIAQCICKALDLTNNSSHLWKLNR